MAKHDPARQVYVYTWEHRQRLMQAWTPAQYTAICALILHASQCNYTQWSSRQHSSCAPIGSSGKLSKWAPTWRWWDCSRATQPPALELEVPCKRNTGVSYCFQGKKRKELTLLDFITLFVQDPVLCALSCKIKASTMAIIKYISVGSALVWKSKRLGRKSKNTKQFSDLKVSSAAI